MNIDGIFPHHNSLQLSSPVDLETLKMKYLIESKYLGDSDQQWKLPLPQGCFSSQTNILKRYPTSLLRACCNNNSDSRAKGKMYSAFRHNLSLDERSILKRERERKENSSTKNVVSTQRTLSMRKRADDSNQMSATNATSWITTAADRVRRIMPLSAKKKRACVLPDSKLRQKDVSVRPDEDLKIVNYYKEKYERTMVCQGTPLSNSEHRLQSQGGSYSAQHSRKKYITRAKLRPPQSTEPCIEPWES